MAVSLSAIRPVASGLVLPRPPVAGIGRIRKIALLGSHYSLDFAPWGDPSWEFWGHASSRGLYQRSPDRYFDLHRKSVWTAGKKRDHYVNWLHKNLVPIYMQERYAEVPASVRYPREQIFAQFRRYFTSHAAYMIALALYEGVTHIGLFGINYSADSEYGTQRGGAEYWLGFAEGRGVQIVLPARCTLLNTPSELYAYESHDEQGRLIPSYRQKKATITVNGEKRTLQFVQPGQPEPAAAPPPPNVTSSERAADRAAFDKAFPKLYAGT
jgi:hypothetical protein